MITPQEAESHVFSKASFGGYNMAQVDAFLDTLIADYGALYKENTALKGKMKVLVDKIDEYRATEDAMRKTLLAAQKMADNIMREAEAKRSAAIQEAEVEASRRINEIRQEVTNEEARLTAARSSTTAYVTKLKELYTKELEYIGNLSDLVVPTVGGEPAPNAVQDIQDTISKMFQPATDSEDASLPDSMENVEEPTAVMEAIPAEAIAMPPSAEGEASDNSDTVIFDRLQFGRDYEIQ